MITRDKQWWATQLLASSVDFWRNQHEDEPIRCFLACHEVADLIQEYEGKPVVEDPTLPAWMTIPQPGVATPPNHEKGLRELGLLD